MQRSQRDFMIDLVRQGQRDGSIRPDLDAEATGLTVNAALAGFLTQQLEQARNAGMDEGMLSQLQADYNRKLSTYDENHPDMIALRRQIETMRAGGTSVDSL